ncbi:MAG: hypothetical protein HYU66_25035 [Armatimonadetes bacterium]|nr:hypothetical protein [Armatimonadota bacterium]
MVSAWREFGWQRMRFVAPAEWFYTKIGMDPASGDLWLNDAELPRLQVKWLDAAREKRVDAGATLERYLTQLERKARKSRVEFTSERDIRLVTKGGRDLSSLESFHWTSDTEAFGAVWYSPVTQRLFLAQVNGAVGEQGLRALAKRVVSSFDEQPDDAEQGDLWTAYDLVCRVPRDHRLTGQTMQTGQTELRFERRRDSLNIVRFGLASIALARAADLGDWAHTQRFKLWITYRLDREEGEWDGKPAVTFRGPKRAWPERLRARLLNLVGQPYAVALTARVWHCPEANCLFLVEHVHDARSAELLDQLCAAIPATPPSVPAPKA